MSESHVCGHSIPAKQVSERTQPKPITLIFGKMYETEHFGQVLSNLRCSVSSKGGHKSCQNAKFTGRHLCWSLFFNKVKGLRPATLFKKRL